MTPEEEISKLINKKIFINNIASMSGMIFGFILFTQIKKFIK